MTKFWEGFHHDGKIPVLISVEYDEENEEYIMEVVRGYDSKSEAFKPKHNPENELMHVSDMEQSIKIANRLLKELKREAQMKRRKK